MTLKLLKQMLQITNPIWNIILTHKAAQHFSLTWFEYSQFRQAWSWVGLVLGHQSGGRRWTQASERDPLHTPVPLGRSESQSHRQGCYHCLSFNQEVTI